jgi:hypothetical protein
METTNIHGGKLTFSEPRHQYHWNGYKVKHTVSGICGEGYPLPFGVPAAWAAKMIRLELIEDMQSHQDGLQFAAVADIENWAKHICSAHTRARDSAGGAGTTFHDFMERHAQGLEPELPTEQPARRSAEALRDWYDANVKRPISTERLVYHKGVTSLKYPQKAGHVGQGAAYCMALRLENIQVDSFILMEVERETGKLRVTRYDDLEREFEAFVWALNLVRYKPQGIEI